MAETSKIILNDLKEISEKLREFYEKLSGRTIVIAGGAGFLGRYLVLTIDYLNKNHLSEPCKVIIVDNFITGSRDWIEESENIKLIEQDITKPLEIEEPVDYIINAASLASPVFYNKYRLETIDAGIIGTKNLLEFARKKNVRGFLFTSSSEVYGNPDEKFIPTNEEYLGNVSCIGPRACYDEPKRIGETLCVTYRDIYNLPIKIARPFNIFGPGIRLDDGRVVPNAVVHALKGKEIPIYGDGKNTRTFCYISNAIVGFYKILLSDRNEIYNVGADYPEIEIRQLADIILGLVGNNEAGINIKEGPSEVYKKADPNRRCPDLTKIKLQLGYDPKINLVTGLKRFIEWVKEEKNQGMTPTSKENNLGYINNCRLCGGKDLRKFISLGNSPLANNLLKEMDEKEEKYPLDVVYCPRCKTCQLSYTIDPDKVFRNYHYVTSTTQTFRKHFGDMAKSITKEFNLGKNSLVVDIGSNDGLLLKGFKEEGVNIMGVEPATNIVEIARKDGVDTLNDYFNENAAQSIIALKGKADVITANNVFAHTYDLKRLVSNVKDLLKDDGVFIIEVQYLFDTIKELTFDNIYHEHIYYFTATALNRFFKDQRMDIIKIEHVNTHGGSIRVYTQKEGGKRQKDSSVDKVLKEEDDFGLNDFVTYKNFGETINRIKDKIKSYIARAKQENKKIVGYGSPAKATTLLNFCEVNNKEIDFIVDDNPLKQGLIVPGVKIPIKSSEALKGYRPNYIIILAWNFAEEIIKNNIKYREEGASFIVPLPEPRIV